MEKQKYIIGIDLGTTNCTMAYAEISSYSPTENKPAEILQFSIPQMIAAGVQGEHHSLPSFVYFPLPEEVKAGLAQFHCLGSYARSRGAELPGRLISSSKSWLCNDSIDRREKILPIDSDEDSSKMSPVEVASELLIYLKEAWNKQMEDSPFESQTILITVPASFDPSARQLIQEAAQLAGYPEVILLEEPLAAFYAWLNLHADSWRSQLKIGDCILVVDIGGGTTDFSLISVEDQNGQLQLSRLAVGSRLLLGGDNMDLALAHLVQARLEEQGKSIEGNQWQSLVHSCRQAKETLLGDHPPSELTITIQGRGSRLIGGALSLKITRDEVLQMLVDGFMPLIEPSEQASVEKRAGIRQIGLPYAQDPRISAQLAKFLSMTGENVESSLDKFVVPSAFLFNGGALKSAALKERLVQLVNSWATKLSKPSVKVLEESNLDCAVSLGAVYYGLARAHQGIRVRAGTSHSYFVGVESAAPAIPGFTQQLKAYCVVPFGMEEGSVAKLEDKEFALILGEMATFRFFSHSTPQLSSGEHPQAGMVVSRWQNELKELHPIETLMERGESDGKSVRVRLEAKVTELGVLELWCVAADGRRWKLEFDIRK